MKPRRKPNETLARNCNTFANGQKPDIQFSDDGSKRTLIDVVFCSNPKLYELEYNKKVTKYTSLGLNTIPVVAGLTDVYDRSWETLQKFVPEIERDELRRLIMYDNAWFATKSYRHYCRKENQAVADELNVENEEQIPGLVLESRKDNPNIKPKRKVQSRQRQFNK